MTLDRASPGLVPLLKELNAYAKLRSIRMGGATNSVAGDEEILKATFIHRQLESVSFTSTGSAPTTSATPIPIRTCTRLVHLDIVTHGRTRLTDEDVQDLMTCLPLLQHIGLRSYPGVLNHPSTTLRSLYIITKSCQYVHTIGLRIDASAHKILAEQPTDEPHHRLRVLDVRDSLIESPDCVASYLSQLSEKDITVEAHDWYGHAEKSRSALGACTDNTFLDSRWFDSEGIDSGKGENGRQA